MTDPMHERQDHILTMPPKTHVKMKTEGLEGFEATFAKG